MDRRRLLVVGGVAAAVLAAWFLLLWSPKGDQLTQAEERTATAELEADNLELRLARLLAAEKNSVALTATADRLEEAVPGEAAVADFILQANEAATESGVDFVSVTPAPPATSTVPGVAAEVKLSIQATGGYYRMLDYLERLLALPRIVVLDSVSVTPSGDGPGETDLTIALSGRMFLSQMPAPTAVTPPAAPAAPAPEGQVAAATPGGSGT